MSTLRAFRAVWMVLVACQASLMRADEPTAVYQDSSRSVEQRVESLLALMTLDEKLEMLSGTGFDSKPNARLGIPAIRMTDGPQGVRLTPPRGRGAPPGPPPAIVPTPFPAGVALAATWDPDLVRQVGRAIAVEAKSLGKDMLLAPCVNIQRVPHGGRNFESYSEDPYLAARTTVAFVQGVQSEGVIATVKHFAANNQEYQRMTISAEIDERVLHEIYFPAFRAAVEEAGVLSVMSAYNKLNGQWCAENPHLLHEVLKQQWGFQGFVVSDWGGTHDTVATANAGLDLEMPRSKAYTLALLSPAIDKGSITPAVVDDKIRRILGVMFRQGLFDRGDAAPPLADKSASLAIARAAGTEGIVLLKNAGSVLPIDTAKARTIAVLGPNADSLSVGGGGSASVISRTENSPVNQLRMVLGSRVEVRSAHGVELPNPNPSRETQQERDQWFREAVALAKAADLAIVFAGTSSRLESEFNDRASLDLPPGQNELIEEVAKVNPRTVVVLNIGAPVLMGPWVDRVAAIVCAWFPGEAGSEAIADILTGAANPAGRLPETFPRRWEDCSAFGHYPGREGVVRYDEGLFVGYRHFDKQELEPQFPFGHGLSYTQFEYGKLEIEPAADRTVRVRMSLKNIGDRLGAEVVQLYVRDEQASVERPIKELKAFRRVALKPGEAQTLTFDLGKEALAYYDPATRAWIAEPGKFEILVGSSSRDIRLRGGFELAP